MIQTPREFIFTFGFGHYHPETGESLNNKYVRVRGLDFLQAREKMTRRFGRSWSFQYSSEAAAGVQRYKLTEIPFEPQPVTRDALLGGVLLVAGVLGWYVAVALVML